MTFANWLMLVAVLFGISRLKFLNDRWLVVLFSFVNCLYFFFQNSPATGDAAFLQSMVDLNDHRIWISEPLSQFFLTQVLPVEIARWYLPPVMGFFASMLWLSMPSLQENITKRNDDTVTDFARQPDRHRLTFRAIIFVSAVMQMMFYRGYAETMAYAMPFALLYLHQLFSMIVAYKNKKTVLYQFGIVLRDISKVGALLGLAALVHGVFFSWIFVTPLIVLYLFWTQSFRKVQMWILVSASLIMPVAVFFAGLSVFSIAGFSFDTMNATGGGDGAAFVPLIADRANPFFSYRFGSLDHIVAVLSIIVYAAVALPVVFVIDAKKLWQQLVNSERHIRILHLPVSDVAIILLFLSFVGFVSVWNFDFGFFWDFDLIFALSLSSLLVTERLLLQRSFLLTVTVSVLQTALWMQAYSRFF